MLPAATLLLGVVQIGENRSFPGVIRVSIAHRGQSTARTDGGAGYISVGSGATVLSPVSEALDCEAR
jgi:hypothetical protein